MYMYGLGITDIYNIHDWITIKSYPNQKSLYNICISKYMAELQEEKQSQKLCVLNKKIVASRFGMKLR